MEYVARLYGCIQVFWSENLDHSVIKQDKICSENACAVCIHQYCIVCGIHTILVFRFQYALELGNL